MISPNPASGSSDGADDNEIDDYVANLGDDTMSGTDPKSKMLRRDFDIGTNVAGIAGVRWQ